MTCKFLAPMFFACVCFSASAQELQSPQINQSAIFVNPGLAGSKGQTRICSSFGTTYINDAKGSSYYDANHSHYYNSSISVDGLILKNSIGAAMYIQNNSYSRSYSVKETYPNDLYSLNESDKVSYITTTVGAIISPKFYLQGNKSTDKSSSISPSFSIGIRNDNLVDAYSYKSISIQDSVRDYKVKQSKTCLSNIVLGFLYNTKNGYAGVKATLLNSGNDETYVLTSFALARNFHYQNDPTSNVTFTPQLFFSFLWNGYNTIVDDNIYRESYRMNIGSNAVLNLDFRYKKLIIGQYMRVAYYRYFKTGLSLGYQLDNLKLIANFSPPIFSENPTTELFLSVNILLKNKNTSSDSTHEN